MDSDGAPAGPERPGVPRRSEGCGVEWIAELPRCTAVPCRAELGWLKAGQDVCVAPEEETSSPIGSATTVSRRSDALEMSEKARPSSTIVASLEDCEEAVDSLRADDAHIESYSSISSSPSYGQMLACSERARHLGHTRMNSRTKIRRQTHE